MNRIRLLATVDAELLAAARDILRNATDDEIVDAALPPLSVSEHSAKIDAGYAAYDEHPIDEPEEWGDLASWRRAAGSS